MSEPVARKSFAIVLSRLIRCCAIVTLLNGCRPSSPLESPATQLPIAEFSHAVGGSTGAAFNPHEDLVVTGSSVQLGQREEVAGQLVIWNHKTNQQKTLHRSSKSVLQSMFTADGKRVIGVFRDRTLKIWEASGERELHSVDAAPRYSFTSVAVSQDGAHFATSAWNEGALGERIKPPGIIEFFTLDGARRTDVIETETPYTAYVCYSPKGACIASCGSRTGFAEDGMIEIFDLPSKKRRHALTMVGTVHQMAFDPVGGRLAAVSSSLVNDGTWVGSLTVWDVQSGAQKFRREIVATCVAFSPDGEFIATGLPTGHVLFWSAGGGIEQSRFQAHYGKNGYLSEVRSISFSSVGHLLVTAAYDGKVRIWDLQDLGLLRK